MILPDSLQCPDCSGRLTADFDQELRCSRCERTIRLVDGVIDFAGDRHKPPAGSDRYHGVTEENGLLGSRLPSRIKHAAGGRWPATLGDVIELGCGLGAMTETVVMDENVRHVLAVDSDLAVAGACRARIAGLDPAADRSGKLTFAAFDGGLSAIRDAVADTVIATAALSSIGDTRGFLTSVHRTLRIGGRAVFVVPNRRYQQVVCLAIAEALTQRFARDGVWPADCWPAMARVAELRKLLVHRDDAGFLGTLEEKHLFDSDALENLAKEIGFATAELIPLDPDPAGGETITQLCRDAGATDDFALAFGPLAATVGRAFLDLLRPQDLSAFGLLWLTKAPGPAVHIYAGRAAGPPIAHAGPESVVGGMVPRWSVELLARDTPDGVAVTVGGWCLSNVDILWLRLSLDDVGRNTPVWRHRPDVHEVLNRARGWSSLNALCSGLGEDLLFEGVHPEDGSCPLKLEILLAGGLVVTGQAPERLLMDQPTVIAH